MSSVFIKRPHADLGEDTLHEWIEVSGEWPEGRYGKRRVGVDSIGREARRMSFANATRWICNNTDCPAMAFVTDRAVVELIERAEQSR